jgi:apolipoprotein N-acyltransferase
MDVDWPEDGPAQFYNSAMLFDTEARLLTTYDKQHLVMFGEYVPLEDVLPFLTAMTPIEASFDAGEGNVVFTLPEPEVPFSVLICFEDTVARLARKAVREGARLLINQTNDAWFEESSASWQHLTHSVLRAVENQVPVVRAANNGVSCGITRFGQVHSVLTDANGSTFVQGLKVVESAIATEPLTPTFYTRHGDLLGVAGLGFYAVIGALVWRDPRRRRSALYSTESGR